MAERQSPRRDNQNDQSAQWLSACICQLPHLLIPGRPAVDLDNSGRTRIQVEHRGWKDIER